RDHGRGRTGGRLARQAGRPGAFRHGRTGRRTTSRGTIRRHRTRGGAAGRSRSRPEHAAGSHPAVTDAPVIVDARGHRCPTPSRRLMKAMENAPEGRSFILLATDPMARIDVPFLMDQKGGAVVDVTTRGDTLEITVRTVAPPPSSPPDVPTG